MRIVVAPDSFKGSISAAEAANAIEMGIRKAFGGLRVDKVPMADGGEGTVEALVMAAGGRIVDKRVMGPLGVQIDSFYGILGDGVTGVVELAAASGLPLVPSDKRNPMLTTTYGTGELIRAAVDAGCRKLIVGIGGSATNDGGTGLLQALGVRFLDAAHKKLGFGGQMLGNIHTIDVSGLHQSIRNVEIIAACDVSNPLCGPKGAHTYGPQKGATAEMIELLDRGLQNFSDRLLMDFGKDVGNIPGSGAAGGVGCGLVAFLDAKLKPGMDIMKQVTAIEDKIRQAQLVITGEGRTDFQTAFGKVPAGVARLAKKHGIPVVCLSGSIGEGTEQLYETGITAMFSITDGPIKLEDAMLNASALIEKAAENIIRLYVNQRKACLKKQAFKSF